MLSGRQEKILSAIIKEYTTTATPVGSEFLVKQQGLPFSSATIRNEMARLEEAGYIIKPHISAGRVPSDKGYRYFVDNLMAERELSVAYQKKLELELLKLKAQNAKLARVTAKLLSSFSQCLAVSGILERGEFYDFGMSKLLEDPVFSDLDEASKLALALDFIDENLDAVLAQIKTDETKIFIGKENPIKEIQNYSMVVAPYQLKTGERGVVAVIGPKRMRYGRNKKLIDFVKKLLKKKQ